jgi:hypothetical protein
MKKVLSQIAAMFLTLSSLPPSAWARNPNEMYGNPNSGALGEINPSDVNASAKREAAAGGGLGSGGLVLPGQTGRPQQGGGSSGGTVQSRTVKKEFSDYASVGPVKDGFAPVSGNIQALTPQARTAIQTSVKEEIATIKSQPAPKTSDGVKARDSRLATLESFSKALSGEGTGPNTGSFTGVQVLAGAPQLGVKDRYSITSNVTFTPNSKAGNNLAVTIAQKTEPTGGDFGTVPTGAATVSRTGSVRVELNLSGAQVQALGLNSSNAVIARTPGGQFVGAIVRQDGKFVLNTDVKTMNAASAWGGKLALAGGSRQANISVAMPSATRVDKTQMASTVQVGNGLAATRPVDAAPAPAAARPAPAPGSPATPVASAMAQLPSMVRNDVPAVAAPVMAQANLLPRAVSAAPEHAPTISGDNVTLTVKPGQNLQVTRQADGVLVVGRPDGSAKRDQGSIPAGPQGMTVTINSKTGELVSATGANLKAAGAPTRTLLGVSPDGGPARTRAFTADTAGGSVMSHTGLNAMRTADRTKVVGFVANISGNSSEALGKQFTATLAGPTLTVRPTMAATAMSVPVPKAGGDGYRPAQLTLPAGSQGGLALQLNVGGTPAAGGWQLGTIQMSPAVAKANPNFLSDSLKPASGLAVYRTPGNQFVVQPTAAPALANAVRVTRPDELLALNTTPSMR